MNKKPAKVIIHALYFAGLGVLILLGGWQLVRGLEKQAIDRQLTAGGDSPVRLDRTTENWQTLNNQQVELNGKWLQEKVFLMENRVYNGTVGHELWAPFMLKEDDMVILVNLGWSTDVQALPIAGANDTDNVTVTGQLTLPGTGFTLGPSYTDQSTWPRRIQYFERTELAKALGMSIAPAILVIDPGESQSLIRIWKPYVMDATRHIGYAVQWWGLAVVLIVFGIIWLKNSHAKQP